MMDKLASITASQFSTQMMVPVSYDKIGCTNPIPAGTNVELIGKVTHVGNKSLKVSVEIYIEEMYSDIRYLAINGEFTFVALDKDKNPTKVIKE